jgi:hypothetical protein
MWLTRDELAACAERHRSPTVLRVDEYLAGRSAGTAGPTLAAAPTAATADATTRAQLAGSGGLRRWRS